MLRVAAGALCLCLVGCVGAKPGNPDEPNPWLRGSDFILQDNNSFFAKPDEADSSAASPGSAPARTRQR